MRARYRLGMALASVLTSIAAAQPAIDTRPVPMRRAPSALAEGWQRGAFIEIFVRAWKDSDGDGIGDLRGLTQTLPYLQALGVRGIWLMPITRNADGDHGYASTDYRSIAPEYGTLADFDALIRAAHRRGIGVIMDYVINHASAQHPLFQQALQGPGNAVHDWFVWRDEAPPGWDIWGANPWYHGASHPWAWGLPASLVPAAPPEARGFYFATFGPHMPDFNFRNADVLAYHESSLRLWLNRGLDGFRLDAVPHLVENGAQAWNDQPESRALVRRLQTLIKAYPRRYLVCEATAEPQAYGDDAVCGGAFAFGYVQHFVGAAQGKPESVQALATYYATASPNMASFISNHDSFAGQRLWDQLGGDTARYRLAAAAYLLQPGTPFIYYGEEIGQAGVPDAQGDARLRGPMSWAADAATAGFSSGVPFRAPAANVMTHNVALQQHDPASLLNFYRALLKLRNGLASIQHGSFEQAFADGLVAGWQRRLRRQTALVLLNFGDQPVTQTLSGLPPRRTLRAAWPERGAVLRSDAQGQGSVVLPALSLRVFVNR